MSRRQPDGKADGFRSTASMTFSSNTGGMEELLKLNYKLSHQNSRRERQGVSEEVKGRGIINVKR